MTKKRPGSHSSVEVKLNAVLQVVEGKSSVAEMANSLELHRDTVNRWVNAYKERGKEGLENPRSHTKTPTTSKDEKIRKLEKDLEEKELENEILKKFQAFLKGSE